MLAIFVHGLFGKSYETWEGFAELLHKEPALEAADLIFWGYDSKNQQVKTDAVEFLNFLKTLQSPARLFNEKMQGRIPERIPFSYKKIVIFAHSLGAVVVRRTLLDIAAQPQFKSKKYDWFPKIQMVLFAPAHNGAKLSDLIGLLKEEELGWVVKKFFIYPYFQYPVISELDINSTVIKSLKDDTHNALKSTLRAQRDHLVPHQVLWAKRERVVINDDFCADPEADLVEGTHQSICKPTGVNHQAFQSFIKMMK